MAKIKDAYSYIFIYDENKNSNEVFSAYQYIKNNTEISSIIATNKQTFLYFKNDYICHDLAAYGERHVYLEGYQYAGINAYFKDLNTNIKNNNFLFSDTSIDDKYNLCLGLNINYIFYYKHQHGSFNAIETNLFKKIFENGEISIFEVNK